MKKLLILLAPLAIVACGEDPNAAAGGDVDGDASATSTMNDSDNDTAIQNAEDAVAPPLEPAASGNVMDDATMGNDMGEDGALPQG